MSTRWIIDAHIDATAIADASGWHAASTIEALQQAGLTREDAEAFQDFLFTDRAVFAGNQSPEDCLNQTQYDRITIAQRPNRRAK